MATLALTPPSPPQPSYDATLNRFVRRQALTLKTAGAETSSNTTDTGVYVDANQVSMHLSLTASSSPTSLAVDIQGSADGTAWFKLGTMATTGGVAQLGAVATGDLYYEGPGAQWLRYKSTLAGTSYTYSIAGTYRF